MSRKCPHSPPPPHRRNWNFLGGWTLVALRGEKTTEPPTKQDLGRSKGFFSKFPMNTPIFFIWEPPLPDLCTTVTLGTEEIKVAFGIIMGSRGLYDTCILGGSVA